MSKEYCIVQMSIASCQLDIVAHEFLNHCENWKTLKNLNI